MSLEAEMWRCPPDVAPDQWARQVTPPREAWEEVAGDLLMADVNPGSGRCPLDEWFDALMARMADETAVDWVRAGLALRGLATADYFRGEFGSPPDPTDPHDAAYREWLADALARWAEAERSVWEAVPWPGIDLADAQARRRFELQDRLASSQLLWCRERLHDPTVRGVALGLCLRRLLDSGELTQSDLDAVIPRWRSRLLKQITGETFSCVPAAVAFGIALAELEVTGREAFWEHIVEGRHRWAESVYAPLVGWFGSAEDVAALWERVLRSKATYRECLGAAVGRARLLGTSLSEACAPAGPVMAETLRDVRLAFGQRPYLWDGRPNPSSLAWRRRHATK